MQVQSLGGEDPLEEEMATDSSILAWKIPWTEEPGGPQSIGSQSIRQDWVHTHVTFLFSSVQLLSHIWLLVTPWTAAGQASLSNTNSRSLLKFMSIAKVMPSNHLILCCPLLFPPSIFLSIRVFSNEAHQMAKVLDFQLQHQSFQWIFRTDFL